MIGYTLRESLQNRTNSYTEDVKYVGFANYVELWQDPEFTHALSNLLKFTAVFMIGCLLSGLIMSLLLEKGIKGEGFFRSTYLYPMAISFIAMGTSWRWLMDSARDADATGLNYLLQKVGLGALQSDWYTSDLFPQLSPTFLTVLIILGHISMKVFDLIFGIATKSYVTKVLAIYMWQVIFDFQNYAKGAAIAIVILLMIAVAVIPYLIYVNKTEEANK